MSWRSDLLDFGEVDLNNLTTIWPDAADVCLNPATTKRFNLQRFILVHMKNLYRQIDINIYRPVVVKMNVACEPDEFYINESEWSNTRNLLELFKTTLI